MQTHTWIALFQEWLEDNQAYFAREKVRVEVLGITPYSPSSIHTNFFGERHEALVQLWEDGLSDFCFWDYEASERDPDYQIKDTHYEFTRPEELFAALDALAARLTGHPLLQSAAV